MRLALSAMFNVRQIRDEKLTTLIQHQASPGEKVVRMEVLLEHNSTDLRLAYHHYDLCGGIYSSLCL
jgi:hypothetical protein